MPVDETNYFFSYARDDSDFALKLAKELRAAGANLWLDQLDIVGGQRWDRAVEEALATCQSMIVVLSPESVASNNVMDEVSYALEENKLVIPVLRKDCSIPFRLRRVQRIDFTADYDTGFADLLRALGIEQPAPTPEPAKAEAAVAEEIDELLEKKQTDNSAETPVAEVPMAYPDFIPRDDPHPKHDQSTPPNERYARFQVIRPIEGRPGLKVGEQYRVKKGLAMELVAKGYLGRVKRDPPDKIEARTPKQPPATTEPPVSEEPIVEDRTDPVEEELPEAPIAEQPPVTTEPAEAETPVGEEITEPVEATSSEAPSTSDKTIYPPAGLLADEFFGRASRLPPPAPESTTTTTTPKPTTTTTAKPAPTGTGHKPTRQERVKGTLAGAIAGAIFGAIAVLIGQPDDPETWLVGALLVGIPGAIAGLISGTHRRVIVTVLVVSVIGWLAASTLLRGRSDMVFYGAIFGVPLGIISGAIVGVILKKWLGWK